MFNFEKKRCYFVRIEEAFIGHFRFLSNEAFTPLFLSKIVELFKTDCSAVSQTDKKYEQKKKINHEI